MIAKLRQAAMPIGIGLAGLAAYAAQVPNRSHPQYRGPSTCQRGGGSRYSRCLAAHICRIRRSAAGSEPNWWPRLAAKSCRSRPTLLRVVVVRASAADH